MMLIFNIEYNELLMFYIADLYVSGTPYFNELHMLY